MNNNSIELIENNYIEGISKISYQENKLSINLITTKWMYKQNEKCCISTIKFQN